MSSIAQTTKELLTRYNFHLKKGLGQNLLTDEACLNRIVEAANLSKDDTVIEIGTGTGILTMELAKKAKKVITFEIDKRIVEIAREYLKDCPNVEIINEDFLKSEIGHLTLEIGNWKFVANVPYYITTPIIEKILDIVRAEQCSAPTSSLIILTVQREFAQRMVAKPGTEQYGSFSIFINYYTEAEIVSYIPKSAFLPQPTVGSAVIRLIPRPVRAIGRLPQQETLLFQIVRAAFNQRRKTLRNALIAKFDADRIDNALSKSGIDPKIRGERLSIEDFVRLAESF